MQSLSYPLPHLPKDPAVLCAKLRHLDNPFVFWLHNDGVPVIGWLPKVAWSLNNQDGLTLIKHTRTQDGYKDSTEPTDIASYQKTVLDYHHAHKKHCQIKTSHALLRVFWGMSVMMWVPML